jgi:hypothetical protein
MLILLRHNHCQKPVYYRPWGDLIYCNNSFPYGLRWTAKIALLCLLFSVRFGLVKPGLTNSQATHFTATLDNKCNASSTLVRSLSGNSTDTSNPTSWPAGPFVPSWSWRNISQDFSLLMKQTLHGSGGWSKHVSFVVNSAVLKQLLLWALCLYHSTSTPFCTTEHIIWATNSVVHLHSSWDIHKYLFFKNAFGASSFTSRLHLGILCWEQYRSWKLCCYVPLFREITAADEST